MSADTQRKIDKLIKAATNARNARNAAQRDAARRFLVQRATELGAIRDELYGRFDACWSFLDWHPDDPDHDANEQQLIDWMGEFDAVVDALERAADVWLGTNQEQEAA